MPAMFYALVCWSVHLHRAGIQTGVFPVFTPLFLLVVFQQGLDGGNQLFSAQVQRFNFPFGIDQYGVRYGSQVISACYRTIPDLEVARLRPGHLQVFHRLLPRLRLLVQRDTDDFKVLALAFLVELYHIRHFVAAHGPHHDAQKSSRMYLPIKFFSSMSSPSMPLMENSGASIPNLNSLLAMISSSSDGRSAFRSAVRAVPSVRSMTVRSSSQTA